MLERDMEDLVVKHFNHIVKPVWSLLHRQYKLGSYRLDLVFKAPPPKGHSKEAHLIVELQTGRLDRSHTYKVLDYLDEYKASNPGVYAAAMVIANEIPEERRKKLRNRKIYFREVPEKAFQKLKAGVDPKEALAKEDPRLVFPDYIWAGICIDSEMRERLTALLRANPGHQAKGILEWAAKKGLMQPD